SRRQGEQARGAGGLGQVVRGPALAGDGGQLGEQVHRDGVGLARSGLDQPLVDHALHPLLAPFGADQGQRPVVVRADPA
ncbi:hypothetical protein DF186_24275, partial [Enterococcus hirae]